LTSGDRIRLVRQANGLELAAVAESAEISVQDLEAFENGQKEPEPEVLWGIADALSMEFGFFLRSLPLTNLIGTNPDGINGLSEDEKQRIIAQSRILAERYLDIESYYPIDEIPVFELPEGFPLTVTSAQEAAQAGEALRRVWGLGHLPIASISDMLEDAGIKVGHIEGAGTFDAAGFVTDNGLDIPIIAVYFDLPGDLQRFAIARELGLLVLEGGNHQLASHFAGAFLAPALALRHELGVNRTNLELYELQLLKQKYGISMRRLITRAASLRIITKEVMNEWMETFRTSGWQTEEPGIQVPSEPPRRMIRLVLRLQAEGEVEQERAAEMLGVPEDGWAELLNLDEVALPEEALES
jgi:transcriptional regulator with XRE-family HTH domain